MAKKAQTTSGEQMQKLSRRTLLGLGGIATMVGGISSAADGAQPTPAEQANAKIVTDFCAAWIAHDIDVLMPYLADNVSYRITETTPAIIGRMAFHDRIKAIIDRMTSIEFLVVDTIAKGPLVLNERRDTLVSPQATRRFHAVGMFFLVDRKIVEWTDYIIEQS
jgi:limonene-1,2-epoxide hydrolase